MAGNNWQAIAQRKQEQRDSRIPTRWRLPSSALPNDPPRVEDGPQNVLNVPRKFLTRSETAITENYTITSLLTSIATRKLSVTEVTTAFCHRAAIAQQLTNCITEPLFETAIVRAKSLDKYLSENGRPLGPLHGLPVSVKDTFDVEGVDTSIGLAALCFKPAKQNAPLIDLLLSMGCIIIAKTNVPQTLASLDSINNIFGRTMNPINRLVTAGGSSGGEGVIVAMKGSMIGFGTDIGGSIRIPAMCNGIYGFKPSMGRLPYGGQAMTGAPGIARSSIQAVAGPIGRSVEDIYTVMRELVLQSWMYGEDVITSEPWESLYSRNLLDRKYVVGVLRSDGNCRLLPPISRMMDELVVNLRNAGVEVVELGLPPAWTKSQSLASKLMGVDGAEHMAKLLESTREPLVPWMKTRFGRGKPRSLAELAGLQAQRTLLEGEMLKLWVEEKDGQRRRRLDAIICPVAPHPVSEIDRYNAVGYTSSWVLLDYPAGSIPVRPVRQDDLELGKPMGGEALGSWDKKNQELWDERTVNRRVYLGTPLSVQVVVPRLEDEKLAIAMAVVDEAVHGKSQPQSRSKL